MYQLSIMTQACATSTAALVPTTDTLHPRHWHETGADARMQSAAQTPDCIRVHLEYLQALYGERGVVNIAPVDCYDPESGALVCLAGVNLAEVLREEIAAADLIDTASGRRRSAAAKARVPDAQLPALLQAKEVSLRVWQLIWSLVAFSMQGPGGKPLQDGLSQSALAQVRPARSQPASLTPDT